MKKFLETVLAFIGLCLFSFFITYALVYAWDFEAELQEIQEQDNVHYMYENRGVN